jgi:hypothetical protein
VAVNLGLDSCEYLLPEVHFYSIEKEGLILLKPKAPLENTHIFRDVFCTVFSTCVEITHRT